MTDHFRLRLKELCSQIAVEKDPHRFEELVSELNRLLEDPTAHYKPPDPSPL
jgi:hypothetical protein